MVWWDEGEEGGRKSNYAPEEEGGGEGVKKEEALKFRSRDEMLTRPFLHSHHDP